MQKKFILFGLLLALLVSCANFPDGKATISGYVVDMKGGEPVVGSTVTVLQTGSETVTDENGFYSIEVLPGRYSLRFTKEGYATAEVRGLITFEAQTRYNTIQRPLFDPDVTTRSPKLRVRLPQWYEPGDTVTVKIKGSVRQPKKNDFRMLDVAIGQPSGSSAYLNHSVRRKWVPGFDGSEVEVKLSTEGYTGIVPIYILTYDINNNRTEIIRYIYREGSDELPDPLAPVNLKAEATTFGDIAVFGPLSVPSLSGSKLVSALKARNIEAVAVMAKEVREASNNASLQGEELRKAISWVDLSFEYDPEADPPEAFEIFRKRADESNFFMVGRVAAADIKTEDGGYAFRDANPGVQPGVELTYRVEAVNGNKRAASETYTLTPLPPFYVSAISPADNVAGVDVKPNYLMSLENSAEVNLLAVIVSDRVQSDGGFDVQYFSPVFVVPGVDGEFNPFDGYVGIPHGTYETSNGGYAIYGDILQPFHAYDWMPFAVTVSLNADGEIEASSIAADYFKLWGPYPVEDGPVNTFLTGAGGGQ